MIKIIDRWCSNTENNTFFAWRPIDLNSGKIIWFKRLFFTAQIDPYDVRYIYFYTKEEMVFEKLKGTIL